MNANMNRAMLIVVVCTAFGCASVAPWQGYLDAPVAAWRKYLDEQVDVRFADTPLSQALHMPPFEHMNYTMGFGPTGEPVITIEGNALTRREILWRIAQEHDLAMTIGEFEGRPSHIEIRTRVLRVEDGVPEP